MFGFVYVWLFVPEVKGLSLEEVDELYRANIKPWNSTSWKPASREAHHIGKKRVVHGEIEEDDDASSQEEKTTAVKPDEKAAVQEKQIENA